MSRRLATTLSLVLGYVILSSALHYWLFPEAPPDLSDVPRSGLIIVNEGIRSTFVYRRTSIETSGQLFEWDNFVDPGGGPIDIPHVHPYMTESFEVVDGEIRFIVDGVEQIAKAGSTIVARPGSVDAFQNTSERTAYTISRFEPADDGSWQELAVRGLLPDNTFVQIHRAGGMGNISAIQMLVIGSRFRQGHPPALPPWAWDTITFLIAPTARLFGVQAYYPPPD